MLRMRFYTKEQWREAMDRGTVVQAEEHEKAFRELLRHPGWKEGDKPPLRDAESIRLLKANGERFVNDRDWYSVIYVGDGGIGWMRRVAEGDEELQAALVIAKNSRAGIYTELPKWMYRKVALVLADMPFDALIAVQMDGMYRRYFPGGGDYNIEETFGGINIVFENSPYHNRTAEAAGSRPSCDNGFYARFPYEYCWAHDIGGILEYIGSLKDTRIYVEDISRIYDVFELGRILQQDENVIPRLDYFSDVMRFCEKAHEENRDMDEEEYRNEIKGLPVEEAHYKEYLYFKDTFRIVTHLTELPMEAVMRRLPMLIVDKDNEGTYKIYDEPTVKYPEFHELIEGAISRCRAGRESFHIVVDVPEKMLSADDLSRTICGFHVTEHCVEIYDSYEAVRRFGAALREAYTSGKCMYYDYMERQEGQDSDQGETGA